MAHTSHRITTRCGAWRPQPSGAQRLGYQCAHGKAQVRENVHKYGKFTNIKSTVVYGGAKIFPQKSKLKKGVDILVATPGRLLDLVNQKAVKLDRVQMLVLDEADHMLDMGFIHDIKKIIAMTPPTRQNLLGSGPTTRPSTKGGSRTGSRR